MRAAFIGVVAILLRFLPVNFALTMMLLIRSRLDCPRTQSDVCVHLWRRQAPCERYRTKNVKNSQERSPVLGHSISNQLRAQWKLLYEIDAPPHLSRDWLRRSVAYRIQENALGGLKPATRRLLERVAEDARARKPTKVVPMRKVGPNTILIREWGGTRHEVTVVENGVMFRGKSYRSLSQVARMITGSQWSGPLFFGLKAAAKEAGYGARQ